MGRRLAPDEAALWARVTATVRAYAGRVGAPDPSAAPPITPADRRATGPTTIAARPASPPPSGERASANTLDGGWDRRLARGLVAPERSIDLHGHTLATAHAALDHALDRAIADDVRLLLIVTGRPPRPQDQGERRRGLIRASIADWLALSRHVGRIAAVRAAHPRHGGAGALYLVLRRRREGRA